MSFKNLFPTFICRTQLRACTWSTEAVVQQYGICLQTQEYSVPFSANRSNNEKDSRDYADVANYLTSVPHLRYHTKPFAESMAVTF